ncbi:hypothetical protein G3N95_30025 [Paraburkholderia sp. Tr-20389]|nr:hypothetical protein [Paraburkholderia sp. Tr-20389]
MPDGGYGFNQKGRAMIASGLGVANAAGGGAGTAVTVVVSGLKGLPSNFGVLVNPGQDATWFVASKTSTGFTITLTPRLAANTLASGTVDWFLFA